MRPLMLLAGLLATTVFPARVLGDSRDLSLPRKIDYCAVVAEVRIDRVHLQHEPRDKFEDLVCECTVMQGFKLPSATNRVIGTVMPGHLYEATSLRNRLNCRCCLRRGCGCGL